MPGSPEIKLICSILLGPMPGMILMMMMAVAGKFIFAAVNFRSALRGLCPWCRIILLNF